MFYNVPVTINKQEDGLWRVEAPDLQGCWVDAPTLEKALAEIHEVIAMVVDVYKEKGWPLPETVKKCDQLPITMTLAVCPTEHEFHRDPAENLLRV